MPVGRRQLFTYYRVAAAQADEAIAAATRMQSLLRERHPGLIATLLRRPATEDSQVTLMETYAFDAAHVPDGVDAALQAAIELQAEAALGPHLAAGRHVEVFVAC